MRRYPNNTVLITLVTLLVVIGEYDKFTFAATSPTRSPTGLLVEVKAPSVRGPQRTRMPTRAPFTKAPVTKSPVPKAPVPVPQAPVPVPKAPVPVPTAPVPVAKAPTKQPVTPKPSALPTSLEPICYICGGIEDASVTNPSKVVDATFADIDGVSLISCKNLQAKGLGGKIDADSCNKILFSEDGINLQDNCDCNNTSTLTILPTPSPNVAAPVPSPTGPEPICYICGGIPEAYVTNPTLVVDVNFANIDGVSFISCQDLQHDGLSGKIDPDSCSKILFTDDGINVQDDCDCNNVEILTIIPTPSPNGAVPTPSPMGTNQICYICGGIEDARVTNPTNVVDASFAKIDGVDFITCENLQEDGLTGNIDPDPCSKIIYTDAGIELQDSCDCNNQRILTIIPTASPV